MLCFCFHLRAQESGRYKLTVLGSRNGLLSPKIYCLAQSSDHHLWIGTEIGASRYNGYGFQNLQYTTVQEQIGKIGAITEDSIGGVWLGGEGGLFYFSNGQLSRCGFVRNYLPAIEALTTDKNGTVWIGEMHGLYQLPSEAIRQWKVEKKPLHLQPFKGINQRITCLDTDGEGNVYFGSFDGVFALANDAPRINLIWQNNSPGNLVRFITAVSPDSIFFNQYNGESTSIINGVIQNHKAKDNVGHSFFKNNKTVFRLTTSTIERLEKNTFIPFINFGMQTNFAFDAICDVEGNIWVGTWEGLFKYRYIPFTVFQRVETQHPETFSLLETSEGKLLFGGNRGSLHYQEGGRILPVANGKPVFPLAEVLAMYEHDDGSYWFGSGYQGITRFQHGKYTMFNESNILPDNHCNTFYRVDAHTVFACTEKGVMVLDPLSENPLKAHYPFAKAYNRQPKLLGVLQPKQHTFFFYSNQGLFRLREGKLYNEMIIGLQAENLYITQIESDSKGRIWVATQGKGLLQCSYSNKGLALERQYTKAHGLLSEELLSVLVDKNEDIWAADYTSISFFKTGDQNASFVNFTAEDGLPDEYYQHLHLKEQKDGRIWGLTSMSLFSFHPDSIRLNRIPPKLFFESMVMEKSGGRIFTGTGEAELSYNENSLSFSFTAVSLSNPSKIKYAYRLMPGNTTWIETGERKLYFNSLNPGKYTVEIKAANNAGLWSAPLEYSFEILPPFWNRAWFYALIGTLILLLIYWLFKRRIKAVNDKAAIRQQLTELESRALRAQMNPHFIFNSLNAIQELIVTKNVEAAYGYLSKFSKLLRLVLNHSEKAAIPLADEIMLLQLYFELESLRFRQSFSYEIKVDKSIDPEIVLVPPLLLQPFIENAVWHGLMLKEGEKKVMLRICQQNGRVLCVIEDNGIGRKKAAEIKAQKIGARHFESKGLKLSQHRIQLLELEGKKGTVKIEDLYENSLAAGTRVSIELPITHNE